MWVYLLIIFVLKIKISLFLLSMVFFGVDGGFFCCWNLKVKIIFQIEFGIFYLIRYFSFEFRNIIVFIFAIYFIFLYKNLI